MPVAPLSPAVAQGTSLVSAAILAVLIFSKYFYMACLGSYYTFYLIEKFHVSIPTSQFLLFLFLGAVAAGTIIGGPIGDRIGRKATFLATMSLMGVSTFAIGLLPSFETAGIVAPLLFVLLRVLQGLALGGEWGGAAIYIVEHVDRDKRGLNSSWLGGSAAFGLGGALLAVLIARAAVGEEAFNALVGEQRLGGCWTVIQQRASSNLCRLHIWLVEGVDAQQTACYRSSILKHHEHGA